MLAGKQVARLIAAHSRIPRALYHESRFAMSTSLSVPRSPRSPPASPSAQKKSKVGQVTIDGDFKEPAPLDQESSTVNVTPGIPPQPVSTTTAKQATTAALVNEKKQAKKARARARKMPPIDSVLLYDILGALGWDKLPAPTEPPSEQASLGPRLWPKKAPAWKQRPRGKQLKQPSEEQEEEEEEKQETTRESSEKANEWGFTEAEFKVISLTSHGDGIAVYPPAPASPQWAIIIPFTVPGDTVKAKVTRHQHFHSFADPLFIVSSNPEASTSHFPIKLNRDDSLVGCQYFGSCAGCQYQYLPYEQQLALKRHVLVKAMRNFSGLPASTVPDIKETIPSPKQYHYRTKITPHFNLPKALQTGKKGRQAPEDLALAAQLDKQSDTPEFDVPIGFEGKCKPGILDIEVCPIATEAIIKAMPAAREHVKQNIRTYKRGATLLMRDSLVPKGSVVEDVTTQAVGEIEDVDEEESGLNGTVTAPSSEATSRKKKQIQLDLPTNVEIEEGAHECIQIHSKTVTERVGDIIFQASHP